MHADLDNPIWTALNTLHEPLAERRGCARRYPVAITGLAGLRENGLECLEDLSLLLPAGHGAALFLTELPPEASGLSVLSIEPMIQMIWEGAEVPRCPDGFVPLGAEHAREMLVLAELTKPGPFGLRTLELGGYIGIFQDGRLAAMAGQRLRMPGYTEISAVCTHPDYRGRRYSTVLMSFLIRRIRERGEIPMLHARAENSSAIRIYEQLGFRIRRRFHLVIATGRPLN